MKKLFSLLVVAVCLTAGTASAQTKIGYIRIEDVVGLMPELAQDKVNLDTVGQKFVQDSIMPQINYKQEEYNRKLKEFSDTVKNKNEAVRKQILAEIEDLQKELGGANDMIQQVLQYKQQEFLGPFYTKARKAIEAVAKEKGYTHVLSTESFIVAPPGDDLTMMVLAKLNIKLPNQNPPAGGGAKPPAKPAGN